LAAGCTESPHDASITDTLIETELARGLIELVHDLTVGTATLKPLPDEGGEAIAALRVPEHLELDQVVPAVALDELRQASLHSNVKRVEHVTKVHPGEPASDVVPLGEPQPDRQPVSTHRSDGAGEPGEGIRVDEGHPGEVDHGDACFQVEGEDAVEVEQVQGGSAGGRHEREYRSSRGTRPEPDRSVEKSLS
jgi:hypothetical protein